VVALWVAVFLVLGRTGGPAALWQAVLSRYGVITIRPAGGQPQAGLLVAWLWILPLHSSDHRAALRMGLVWEGFFAGVYLWRSRVKG
jgi:hypothetical protein